jgi:hypothetical protein
MRERRRKYYDKMFYLKNKYKEKRTAEATKIYKKIEM